MTTVLLGNPQAKEGYRTKPDGPVQYRPVDGEQITRVILRDDATIFEAISDITAPQGVWAAHADAPPSWVASDNSVLAQVLAQHFGGVPVWDYFDLDELAAWGAAVAAEKEG